MDEIVEMQSVDVRVTWVVVTVLVSCAFCCLLVRVCFLAVVTSRVERIRAALSKYWIFQSAVERARAKIVRNALSTMFKGEAYPRVVVAQPQFVAATLNEDGLSIDVNSPGRSDQRVHSHWPVFRIAYDGKLSDNGLVVSNVPAYPTDVVVPSADVTPSLPAPDQPQHSAQSEVMLSAERLRQCHQPLAINNSMNIQNNSENVFSSPFGGSSENRGMPLDQQLFVNTSMTTQQRIDLYRRLNPHTSFEPALQFQFNSN